MQANASDHLHGRLVVDRRDARLREQLGAKLGVTDSQRKLLLLRAFRLGEVGGEEIFERGGHLWLTNSLDVIKSFLGSLEGVRTHQFSRLGEPVERLDGLLHLREATTRLIVVFLHEEEVALG